MGMLQRCLEDYVGYGGGGGSGGGGGGGPNSVACTTALNSRAEGGREQGWGRGREVAGGRRGMALRGYWWGWGSRPRGVVETLACRHQINKASTQYAHRLTIQETKCRGLPHPARCPCCCEVSKRRGRFNCMRLLRLPLVQPACTVCCGIPTCPCVSPSCVAQASEQSHCQPMSCDPTQPPLPYTTRIPIQWQGWYALSNAARALSKAPEERWG